MMSRQMLTVQQSLKGATALFALSMLTACATTKSPAPAKVSVTDQGSIGDADVPQVVYRADKGPYRDPLVSTGHKATVANPAKTSASATPEAQETPAAAPQDVAASAPAQGGLYAAHPQETPDTATGNSIVPSGMPARSIQATVTSVYSLQKPAEQQAQIEPVEPAPAAPVVQKQRPPSKAEILAGLAPDPRKRQQSPQMRQTVMPGQITPAMAAQLNPAAAAQLQASIPTASPAAANSTAATQMEQIEGAPQAQGMTRDSFIKKFLAKLRK
ncbi:hypothetical protein H4S14_004193 [Agrobacterium vitis]|nr:hypothetical protein [Agrobacterium vitis]MBE1440419.1 hypothetical protein [Agrobacterium vitis]